MTHPTLVREALVKRVNKLVDTLGKTQLQQHCCLRYYYPPSGFSGSIPRHTRGTHKEQQKMKILPLKTSFCILHLLA